MATARSWRPSPGQALTAFGAGLVLAGAFPGWSIWPLSLVALAPLIYLCYQLPFRPAFTCGWLFGLAQGLAQLYWLVVVMTTYGGLNWPLAM
ncbi:MAG: hypothetical protein PVG03_11160, partial [Desulfarculaceae bacterium]